MYRLDRRQMPSAKRLQVLLYVLLLSTHLAMEVVGQQDCSDNYEECILHSIEDLAPEEICPALQRSLDCFSDFPSRCKRIRWQNSRLLVLTQMDEHKCTVATTLPTQAPPTTPPPTTTTPAVCKPIASSHLYNSTEGDPVAVISEPRPPPHPLGCSTKRGGSDLHHCSLFSYSHLRPFGQNRLRSCFVPGSWYLLREKGVARVWVHSSVPSRSLGGGVTRIDRVTVTFLSNRCHGNKAKVYTATPDSLPTSFADGTTSSQWGTVTLEVSANHALLRSSQHEITVSIRLVGGHMAVSVQAPMTGQAPGLCASGCPAHTRPVGVDEFLSQWCRAQTNVATLACALRTSILNPSPAVDKYGYLQACQFDVLTDEDLTSLHVALLASQDADFLQAKVEPTRRSHFQAPGRSSTNTPPGDGGDGVSNHTAGNHGDGELWKVGILRPGSGASATLALRSTLVLACVALWAEVVGCLAVS